MKHITKLIAAGAVASMLVPALAFAQGTEAHANLGLRIEKGIEHAEKKDLREVRKGERETAHATSTAASITKRATRVSAAADTMLSFSDRISALIAASPAEGQAALQATFAQFTANATSAKTSAAAALTAAGSVNASNSTTTNAAFIAQAKTNIRAADGFLSQAKQALFSVLKTLWK